LKTTALRERCEITIGIRGVGVERRGPEPGRRGNSVNEEFRGEVLVEEMGLVLGLVDNPPLPLEDLHEQLLYRRHLLLPLLLQRISIKITLGEREGFGVCDERWESGLASSAAWISNFGTVRKVLRSS
jgi:hypothetical protein